MSDYTTEQQIQSDQEYHRADALRQAREFAVQQNLKLSAAEIVETAGTFYDFVKNGPKGAAK